MARELKWPRADILYRTPWREMLVLHPLIAQMAYEEYRQAAALRGHKTDELVLHPLTAPGVNPTQHNAAQKAMARAAAIRAAGDVSALQAQQATAG